MAKDVLKYVIRRLLLFSHVSSFGIAASGMNVASVPAKYKQNAGSHEQHSAHRNICNIAVICDRIVFILF